MVDLLKRLQERLQNRFRRPAAIEPGVYHYEREFGGRRMRLHLRADPDGAGLLSINASIMLHLNTTATELMKHVLDGLSEEESVKRVQTLYRASASEVRRDYARIREIIHHVETSEDECPVLGLSLGEIPPFGRSISAPYRVDLALTYGCNSRCQHCYVGPRPDKGEALRLEEWKVVLDKLWAAGVPHVCFTGGEATTSPYLVELVERAEDIGLITGLLTNGRRLADNDLVQDLCRAGLDHVQITLESHDPVIHDEMVGSLGAHAQTTRGIRNALADDIYLVTNTTLSTLNAPSIEETIEYLKELGVEQFAMNSLINTGKAPASGLGIEEDELEPILERVTLKAQELNMRFIWYSPTHYCVLNPTELGIGYKRCTAGEYNIAIEPDGQVLPCQSYFRPVGHILQDPWEDIWHSPLFQRIRAREDVPELCDDCPDFEICGGGCPLSDGERFVCSAGAGEG